MSNVKRKVLTTVLCFLVLLGLLIVYPKANYSKMEGEIIKSIKNMDSKIIITDDLRQDKKPHDVFKNIVNSSYLTAFEKQNIQSYQTSTSKKNDSYVKAEYTVVYKNTKEDLDYARSIINKYIKENNIRSMDEYNQLRSVYEFVIDSYSYNYAATTTKEDHLRERNVAEGLKGSPVVCDAYALLTSLMLDELGYENIIVKAYITQLSGKRLGHGWNIVRTSQGWYYMDTTWGDSNNQSVKEKYFLQDKNSFDKSNMKYKFFDKYPTPEINKYEYDLQTNDIKEKEVIKEDEIIKDKEVIKGKEDKKDKENKVIKDSICNDCETNNNTLQVNNNKPYITGYSDGSFKGNNKITREEAVTIINNILDNPEDNYLNHFTDLDNKSWSYKNILKVSNLNIVNGYKDNTFRPKNNITRAEALKISLSLLDIKFENNTDKHWAYNYIQYALNNDIVKGYSDGDFKPNNDITRAEFVTIINKVIGKSSKITSDNNFKDIDNTWYKNEVLKASNYTE